MEAIYSCHGRDVDKGDVKKLTFEFLSGRPVEVCQYVKKTCVLKFWSIKKNQRLLLSFEVSMEKCVKNKPYFLYSVNQHLIVVYSLVLQLILERIIITSRMY